MQQNTYSNPGQPTVNTPAPNQTPGGLNGTIGSVRYGAQGNKPPTAQNLASVGGNYTNPNPTRPGDNANASAWLTNNGPIDTGVDSFRQFGDQYYQHTMDRMRPDMDARNSQLAQSLINRGLQPGTEAYNAEMQRMDNRNNDMMSAAALGAEQLGLQAQNQYFGQAMQNNQYDLAQNNQNYSHGFGYDNMANQRAIAAANAASSRASANAAARASMYGADQQNYRAELANALGYSQLNEGGRQFDASNILNTQGQDQNFLLGLLGQQNAFMNTGLNQFNTQQNADNQWWNQGMGMTSQGPGVYYTPNTGYQGSAIQANQNHMGAIGSDNQMMAGLAGGLLGGFSDSRMKENIEYVDTVDGYNVCEWNYIGDDVRYRGVMADEVILQKPEAIRWYKGMMRVIYDMLPVDMEVVQ